MAHGRCPRIGKIKEMVEFKMTGDDRGSMKVV